MATILQRGIILIALFLVCFLGALFLRGADFSFLMGNGEHVRSEQKMPQFEPEEYDLQLEPILESADVSLLKRLDQERTNLINRATKSVVCISTEGLQRRRFQKQGVVIGEQITPVRDVGSGVIVSKQGHVVTNYHVVAGKTRFVVTMHNGYEYDAKLIGQDATLDIAVLRVEAEEGDFQPMPFGESTEVQVGQTVYAVGNPFGLGATVTQGIISAKERFFSDEQGDLFQTDAAINPGNSGGPLINVKGEIIGINVAVFSTDENQPHSQGVGFSIPSNEVLRSFQQIAEKGRPIRGYLGVTVMDVTPEIQAYLDYKGEGVAITAVTKESPAASSGLAPKDVIKVYNGEMVEGREHIKRLIQNSPIDREVAIKIWRAGEEVTLSVNVLDFFEVGDLPKEKIKDAEYREVMNKVAGIGLKVRDLEWKEKKIGGEVGVIVSAITPGSMADKLGLRANDRVLSFNEKNLVTDEESTGMDKFYKSIKDSKVGVSNSMVFKRGNLQRNLKFSFQSRK